MFILGLIVLLLGAVDTFGSLNNAHYQPTTITDSHEVANHCHSPRGGPIYHEGYKFSYVVDAQIYTTDATCGLISTVDPIWYDPSDPAQYMFHSYVQNMLYGVGLVVVGLGFMLYAIFKSEKKTKVKA